MRQFISFLLFLSCAIMATTACKFSMDCLEPDDEIVKDTIRTGNFEKINLTVSGEVVFVQSDEYHVIFEGPVNYFEALKVVAENGTLRIRANRCFAKRSGYYFQIGAPDLSLLH